MVYNIYASISIYLKKEEYNMEASAMTGTTELDLVVQHLPIIAATTYYLDTTITRYKSNEFKYVKEAVSSSFFSPPSLATMNDLSTSYNLSYLR